MIIKFKTSKTPRYKQLLEYLTKDTKKTENDRGEALIIKQGLLGKDNRATVKEFYENEKNRIHRKSNNVLLNHEIISFSDLDKSKITIPILKDLTEEYLRQRSPYMQAIAVTHFDTEHVHVHIMSSPIELVSRRNLRMSQTDFAALKIHMQAYQMEKYPELVKSIVRHGKKEKEWVLGKAHEPNQKSLSKRKESVKLQICKKVELCLTKAKSNKDFIELLATEGLSPYRRGNDWKGVSLNGRNYRFKTFMSDFPEQYAQLGKKTRQINDLKDIRDLEEYNREQNIDWDYNSFDSGGEISYHKI